MDSGTSTEKSHVYTTSGLLKTKIGANGNVERYKAILVVCGNEQLFGAD